MQLTLEAAECRSLQHLLVSDPWLDVRADCLDRLCIAGRLSKHCRLVMVPTESCYIDFRFILVTYNICDRLFLVAGFTIGLQRKRAFPNNIESQLFSNVKPTLQGIGNVHDRLS